jgi:predicted  nucleic acid-binding Zn-ribbon protein
MSETADPAFHQRREEQFIAHVEQLLSDDRLRLDTTRGRRPISSLIRDVSRSDRGIDLKRLMSELGKPDRALEAQMPVGEYIDVVLSHRKWRLFKATVGKLHVACISPARALVQGQPPSPASAGDVAAALGAMRSVPVGVPSTVVIMSTSGFAPGVGASDQHGQARMVILAAPDSTGGWTIDAPPQLAEMAELFDPEAEAAKRLRIRRQIEASTVDLLSGGVASDKLAAATRLSEQLVESELKSYARQNPGLAARRLDGRMVLYRESAAPVATTARAGGFNMPFIDRLKTLFARKGEVEKKIAFLSERRAALSQQCDRGYQDMGALETREAELRQQFKDAGADLARRRITSQLLQLHKDIERRQQLLSVLNRQINIVSTHLHNLELQRQGKVAKLPDSEALAKDAAAAEEAMAELEANSELADSVGAGAHGGLSDEEQALYEELLKEQAPPAAAPSSQPQQSTAPATQKSRAAAEQKSNPPASAPRRSEPEAG